MTRICIASNNDEPSVDAGTLRVSYQRSRWCGSDLTEALQRRLEQEIPNALQHVGQRAGNDPALFAPCIGDVVSRQKVLPMSMRVTAQTPPSHPDWMDAATAELGTRRFPVGETNPRIVEYNNHTNLVGYDDKISWCSSFVNWCMARVGMSGTGSALARSWLEWGDPLDTPCYGCIAVLTRDDPSSWRGHVGFYLRHDADFVYLLGGNQLEEVRELAYPIASVLGYRWPIRMS